MASEEDWQRRSEKRCAAIDAIKDSPEYRALQQDQEQGCSHDAVPEAPDPDDRLTSKRRWEAKVMRWKHAIKQWYARKGGSLSEEAQDELRPPEGQEDLGEGRRQDVAASASTDASTAEVIHEANPWQRRQALRRKADP